MSNIEQFKKDLKQCKTVMGYVKYNDDDGTHFEMKKTDVLFVFKDYPLDTYIDYRVDFVHNTLYIN
jgi:hypothetical protein